MIKKITNYKGNIIFNKKMPDGVKQKKLDITKLKKLGWGKNKFKRWYSNCN